MWTTGQKDVICPGAYLSSLWISNEPGSECFYQHYEIGTTISWITPIDAHDFSRGSGHKDPVTDNNKRSKRGKLKLIRDNTGCYKTVQIDPTEYEHAYKLEDRLVPVFKDGKLLKDYSFAEIRERINAYF